MFAEVIPVLQKSISATEKALALVTGEAVQALQNGDYTGAAAAVGRCTELKSVLNGFSGALVFCQKWQGKTPRFDQVPGLVWDHLLAQDRFRLLEQIM